MNEAQFHTARETQEKNKSEVLRKIQYFHFVVLKTEKNERETRASAAMSLRNWMELFATDKR